jgi:hypothetical protein
VAAGKDREALAIARTEGPEVRPSMSAEELCHVDGLLESAAMAVNIEEATTRRATWAKQAG